MESKAKEIFNYYLGSKYQMMRDELVSEYLSYKISKETEAKWIEELFALNFNNLKESINDENSLFNIYYLIECHNRTDKVDIFYDLILKKINEIIKNDTLMLMLDRLVRMLDASHKEEDRNRTKKLKQLEQLLAEKL